MQRQLATAATEWQSANRDASFLLTGARLEQFEGWSLNTTLALTGDERGYLDASISERERTQAEEATRQRRELEAARKLAETERARAEEQTHSANRLRTRNRAITVVGAIALVLAVLAGLFGFQSENARRLASARELAYAALANLKVDPERSILLALQAISTTRAVNGSILPEAEEALHRSVLASHVRLTLVGHTTPLIGVVYSPDGKRLATIGKDGTVKVWDAATGQELLNLPGAIPLVDAYGPQRLAFSPDGALLASSDNNLVKIWDSVSGKELRTLSGHTVDVWAVAFSPDGKRLATGGLDTTVHVWEVATGELLLTLSGHTDAIELLAFSPDGIRLATSSDDSTVKVWESVTGELLLDLAFSLAPCVAFSPDGTRLAIGIPEGRGFGNSRRGVDG